MHFEIDERGANYVDLVAAQCTSLYTFPYNKHILLNVVKWETSLSHASVLLNKSWLGFFFLLFEYLLGRWSWFAYQLEYFAYCPEDTFYSCLSYFTWETLFHFCIYSCSINMWIRPRGFIFSSALSWSCMDQPNKLLLLLTCGAFLKTVLNHWKTFSRCEAVL